VVRHLARRPHGWDLLRRAKLPCRQLHHYHLHHELRGHGRHPRHDQPLSNAKAGTWHIYASAFSTDRVQTTTDSWATINFQRKSQLTANAAPEPVKKGKSLTVTGKLSRANWNTHKYAGYSGQRMKLQYRPKNNSTYTTFKTVTTSSTGELKTTVKATADGYYRYSFPGTTTTPAINAAGDYVDVA
jgi:hypothetical protein